MKRIAICGAGRGLGKEIVSLIQNDFSILVLSRHHSIANNLETAKAPITFHKTDFSDPALTTEALQKLIEFDPHHVWYFAGGGPYGGFSEKEWKDQLWAYHVNLLSPAQILHRLLKEKKSRSTSLLQVILTGSLIAEETPEPFGAAYASAKKGLKGLCESLWDSEQNLSGIDLRLFSPTYFESQLIPRPAQQRLFSEGKLMTLAFTAHAFLEWGLHNRPADRHYRLLCQKKKLLSSDQVPQD